MAGISAFVCLLALLLLDGALGTSSPPKYVEKYTEQSVDHFNFEVHDTFLERYFLSSKIRASTIQLECTN